MAEPLSLAASLVALAGFAFQTSKSLYEAIDSVKSSKRAIRELREELQALNHALEALQQVAADNEKALEVLKFPLLRCAKICRDFEDVINRFSTHSDQQRTSFRDWAKLQYMGSDITHLKNTLAGYKATINIAIGGATFHNVTVTTTVVNEYKQMISDAISDLHDHLQEMEDRLKELQVCGEPHRVNNPADEREVQEEKESIKRCLEICSQVSNYIANIEPSLQRGSYANDNKPQQNTGAILIDFKTRLAANSTELRARLRELDDRFRLLSQQKPGVVDEDHTAQLENIKEEKESLTHCLAICADASNLADNARTNEFEDIVSADNSQQVIVSTVGDLISARHIVTGSGSLQCMGQMSDETVQKLSREPVEDAGDNFEAQSQGNTAVFQHRYGTGYQLRDSLAEMKAVSPESHR